MPNYFNLMPKDNPDSEPLSGMAVDEAMCAHFGVPCHPTLWHHGWYDTIGFRLAIGRSFDDQIAHAKEQLTDIRAIVAMKAATVGSSAGATVSAVDGQDVLYWQHQLEILEWMKANYVCDAFATVGK